MPTMNSTINSTPLRTPLLLAIIFALFLPGASIADLPRDGLVLIPFDASWRYHDKDEDLGTDWIRPDFDDSEWSKGPALLGYDTADRSGRWPEPGLQTELTPNLATYYFRIEFNYDGPTEGVSLNLRHIIDDGAAFYLNGVELGRTELMPEGEITHATLTTTWTNPSIEDAEFELDPSLLRRGRNVLAVSVHNQSLRSSDICLGVELTVTEDTAIPPALYLSWQRDPTTTMTIQWHFDEHDPSVRLVYAPAGSDDYREADISRHPMVFVGRPIYTVELSGLRPDANYKFRILRDQRGASTPTLRFRTMPATADERPIRAVVGGDVLHRFEWMARTNAEAARMDPDFIVWGGDLAYADGREDRVGRWYSFFRAMNETLILEDGRVIPVLMGIGNHEVVGGFYWGAQRGRESYENTDEYRESIAPYYYNMFAFPGHPGYDVLDFGDYMSIILLDTDHSGPVEGAQTEWLAEIIAERKGVPHIIPVYHYPAFPSVRDYFGAVPTRIREHWLPLFERYGVRIAFENHDHAYKRTVPIKAEREDPDGIVYIGDGAWGVSTREVHVAADTPYLAKSTSQRHFILLTIKGETQDLKVFNEDGRIIDHHISRPFSLPDN